MKKNITLFLLVFNWMALTAQNVGIGTNTPHPSAKLDVTATDRGLLLPRVTLVAVNDGTTPVNAPATGLLVYNTNATVTGGSGEGFYYWNGTQWVSLSGVGAVDNDWAINGNGTGLEAIPGGSTASGNLALAAGLRSIASGRCSYSFGQDNIASGMYSIATGQDNEATAIYAYTHGQDNDAINTYAYAYGQGNQVTSEYSFAHGETNVVSGISAVAYGQDNIVPGNSSFVFGETNQAQGNLSIAIGESHLVSGDYGIVIGGFQNTSAQNGAAVLGGRNHTANGAYSIVAGGENNQANNQHATTIGGVGNISGGQYSATVGGLMNTASGIYSGTFAGRENIVSTSYSTIIGGRDNGITNSYSSILGGRDNVVSNDYAAIIAGRYNRADGRYSMAAGSGSVAASFGEIVVGLYNTTYTPSSANGWRANDRIFVVGKGQDDLNRSNAMTVYKDGSININDSYTLPTTDGGAGNVLTTDGSGLVSWQAVAGGWGLAGNGVTNPATDFIGTTDNVGLNIRTNNVNRIQISNAGNIGINIGTPTATLDVNGTTGFDQLRLRQAFTPTSTADASGNVGDVSWDDNFIYIKTSTGWKRSALTTF